MNENETNTNPEPQLAQQPQQPAELDEADSYDEPHAPEIACHPVLCRIETDEPLFCAAWWLAWLENSDWEAVPEGEPALCAAHWHILLQQAAEAAGDRTARGWDYGDPLADANRRAAAWIAAAQRQMARITDPDTWRRTITRAS